MSAPRRERAILHVDMDAFFASVEQLEHPELRNRPLIVGGDGARGVVASCSYEARAYGIRSAMPSSRAKRLCPHAVFVSGNYGRYQHYSRKMLKVFAEFTPLIEPLSLDEAFLDVTGARGLFGSPTEIAWAVKDKLRNDLGLDASVGVATSKHVAKLASVAAKPRATKQGTLPGAGVMTVPAEETLAFLRSLPVNRLWGVGPKATERLASLGINTVAELADVPLARLEASMGKATAQHLHALAWNRDERDVVVHREAKSVGHEQTYAKDLSTHADVHRQFVRLADAVCARLREADQVGRTITLKVRFSSFKTITRSRTLPNPTANAATLVETADALSAALPVGDGVRLLGISVSNIEATPEQLTLGAEPAVETDPRRALLDSAIDGVRARFGRSAVVPGQLIEEDGPRILRKGDQQWGPSEKPS